MEVLGTRLTKGLIGRPLLQTPTTGAMQGRPGDEANQRPLGRPLLQTPTTGAMQGRSGDEANQRPYWKATTTNTTANCKPTCMLDPTGVSGSKQTFMVGR